MNYEGQYRGGWYHNGSETRRFSDTLPRQKVALHDLRSTLFRLIGHHIGRFKWSARFPGHDASSIADRFARAYDGSPVAFSCDGRVSIDHVRDTQRTGEYALEDRDEAPTVKPHHP